MTRSSPVASGEASQKVPSLNPALPSVVSDGTSAAGTSSPGISL